VNEDLQAFARQRIKKGLARLPEGCTIIFKRMYAGGNLEMPIDDVVDSMPAEKLDCAMQQVQRSLDKEEK